MSTVRSTISAKAVATSASVSVPVVTYEYGVPLIPTVQVSSAGTNSFSSVEAVRVKAEVAALAKSTTSTESMSGNATAEVKVSDVSFVTII